MSVRSSEALSTRLFTVAASALGALMVTILGVAITSLAESRKGIAEIQGALPHIQERVDRIERRQVSRIEQIERRLRWLEDRHRGDGDGSP